MTAASIKPKLIQKNSSFIAREQELSRLKKISLEGKSAIVVVYGRRRIGKTELLEQAFAKRNLLKFEGIEGKSTQEQIDNVLWQLSEYTQNPLMAKLQLASWKEVFKLIADQISTGKWTVYFEEVQWLANYQDDFISELKLIWDNYFRYNNNLILILCGSSPSFIVNKVLYSKALYNRSQHEILVREFNLIDTKKMLPRRSNREVMDAFLTIGGVPEYLKIVNQDSSVFLSLCKNAFVSDSFFSCEYQRIFTSSMANNKYYKAIIEYLSKVRFASRADILKHLKLKSGGKITDVLADIETCGFIEKYSPYNLNDDSRTVRFAISDQYLQFYYKFIKPKFNDIVNGSYNQKPSAAINMDSYYKWLGFAFERMCRKYHRVFAKILGFSGVEYQSGVYFKRSNDHEKPGYQIDLIYDRADKVYTICEIRYLNTKVGTKIIEEFEKKLELFPRKKNYTLHKVLITSEGADKSLCARAYFDKVITFDEIFQQGNW